MNNNNLPSASLANQTNPIEPGYHETVDYQNDLTLSQLQAAGGKITRVRFLTDYIPQLGGRVADISYVHGETPDGVIHSIKVTAPQWSLIPQYKIKGALIEWAKEEKVYAKGLGLLDEGNWSILY